MHQRREWILICLMLGLAVTAPTAGVLWFVAEAISSERLAVKQRLLDAYQQHFESTLREIRNWLAGPAADGKSAPEVFHQLVISDRCDGAIISDAKGDRLYPADKNFAPKVGKEPQGWKRAQSLERSGKYSKAAQAYAELVENMRVGADGSTPDIQWTARSMQAQARCLYNDAATTQGLDVLFSLINDIRLRDVMDENGRNIVANASMLALETSVRFSDPRRDEAALLLAERLNDYRQPTMPSEQRRFLMTRAMQLAPAVFNFPTLKAENLSASWLEQTRQNRPLQDIVVVSASPERTMLFRRERFIASMNSLLEQRMAIPGVCIQLALPDEKDSGRDALFSAPLLRQLNGWRIRLYLEGGEEDNPFSIAARQQALVYIWTGILIIGCIFIAVILSAGLLIRQTKLTRLKNDLIATVSHELKTPLASMRALTETLLDEEAQLTPEQRCEYLELMSQENTRLTSLINNFLAFSRMERGKRVFHFRSISAGEVVVDAVKAVRERFDASGCVFSIEASEEALFMRADHDAMTTVLVNLLDNAYKYTRDNKRITLRVGPVKNGVQFEVEDNGIGIPQNQADKIFNRFYQVDQRVARETEGCGLGLSIAKFIVDAHGGIIEAISIKNEGSRFTVVIPANVN